MDLDSVIRKQKQKEQEKVQQDWYPPNRKRPFNQSYNKYDKEGAKPKAEEDSAANTDEHGVISLSQKNNNLRNKRPKTEEEPEEGEGNYEGYTGGYKGKKPYFPPHMMGYMPPMDYYASMYMDPYMMYGGYMKPFKPKKFKNKTLIVKKNKEGEAKPAEASTTEKPSGTS